MDIPEKINQSHLAELRTYVLQQKDKASKELNRRASCAVWGHVAYHLILVAAILMLFYIVVIVGGDEASSWLAAVGNTLAPLFFVNIEEADTQSLLLALVISVVWMLVIPYLACLLARVCSASAKEDGAFSNAAPEKNAPKETARKLIEEIEEAEKDVAVGKWRDFYPMYELDWGFDFNAYNILTASCIMLALFGMFLFGIEGMASHLVVDVFEDGIVASIITVILWIVCFALVSFVIMLVFLPVWKLSAIISARAYSDLNTVSFGDLKAKLKAFVTDCEEEEAEKRRIEEQIAEQNRRKEEQDRLNKADALYRKAMEADEPDMEMMEKAAELGSPDACWEYGKHLYIDSCSGQYTWDEREVIHKKAAGILEKAKDVSAEAEFLWIACRATYEENDIDGWKKMLHKARSIKNEGKISECFSDVLDLVIQKLVQTIDKMSATPVQQTPQKKGHFYCKFYNAGICNHQSTEYYIHKCTDPVNQCCTHCLLNNGRAYKEF